MPFLEKEVSINELIKIPFPWEQLNGCWLHVPLCIQNRNTNACFSSVKRIFSIVSSLDPERPKSKVKLCFTKFYKLINFKANPFIGVQRFESHRDVFHEKSVLKHIRSAIAVKNPEKYLRRRLVLINFIGKLNLLQILLKVVDHMKWTTILYTSYITTLEHVPAPP